jgi:Fic family protein
MHDPLVHAPAKYRRACRYHAYIPDRVADLDISVPADTLGAVSEAEHAVRDLNESGHPALAPLARLLLRTESIASSKVEGLQVGVRELARAEARVEGGGRASQTAIDILANIDAMELAIREAASVKRFGVKQIVTIHHRLMQNAPNAKVAGRLRTQQNWIGGNDYNPCGADFVPPPPDEIDGLLADLCAAVNDDVFPPLVQAALVHAQFETIHPFDDGNGRTGRALIHVVLRRRGLAPAYVPPISVMFAKRRDRYIGGLTAFRKMSGTDGVVAWIEHFAGAAAMASHLARAYLEAVQSLTTRWRTKLQRHSAPRADAAAWSLIDLLPAHPVITAQAAISALGKTKPTVYQAIQQLADAGVLVPLSSSARNRSWEATGLLDLLGGLEAGQLPSGK